MNSFSINFKGVEMLVDKISVNQVEKYLRLAVNKLIENYDWGNYSTEYNGEIFSTSGFDDIDEINSNIIKIKIFIDSKRDCICNFIISDLDNFKIEHIIINDLENLINFIKSVEQDLDIIIFKEFGDKI